MAAVNALVHGEAGWTVDAALLMLAGVGLSFGCWWVYFAVPWAEPLVRHRERAFPFGYGHFFLFGAVAAMGAGLHVAAYQLEGKAEIGVTATVLSVAVPLALYTLIFYGLYSVLMRDARRVPPRADRRHARPGRRVRRAGGGRGGPRDLPRRRHARAGGDDRGLRDDRPQAHRRDVERL